MPRSGFGYPLHGLSTSNPLWSLSTTNTLGVRPSEPCSFPMISPKFLRDHAFLHSHAKHLSFASMLQRFKPTRKAVPLCFQRIKLDRDLCSLELLGLLGILPLVTAKKSISLFRATFSTFLQKDLTIFLSRALKALSHSRSAFSSFEDANLSDLLASLSPAYSLKSEPTADYFFISKFLSPYGDRIASLYG